jgi:drug/metabolite transporter (DMT)-like permease
VGRLVLVLAVLAVSTAAPLVRWAAPAHPLTVAASRVGLAALILVVLSGPAIKTLAGLPRRERWLTALAGLFLAAHFGAWISSLYYTSTAASLALVATQPIFAGLIAWVALGEGMSRRELVGIGIAGAGCLVLASGDIGEGGGGALLGDALALIGAITAAAYYVVGRRLRAALPLLPYLAGVNLVAGALLAAAALLAGTAFAGFDGTVYLALALSAIVPSVVGHTLLNWSVRRVPVHLVALGILGEPVGASALTWLFFAETPPSHAAAGGAVILAGIAIGFLRGHAPAQKPAESKGGKRVT